MFIRNLIGRWQGVVLSLIGLVATLWLALTGQLALYIHPRYFLFTVAMAVIATALALASFVLVPASEGGHSHSQASQTRGAWLRPAGSILTVTAAVVGLLILPPATLTTATVAQRDLNGSASALTASTVVISGKGDYSAFTVRDWASLLHTGADLNFFTDKSATVTGFVTPDKSDPDVFFVARFVVTCCAVDAQPVGIPVYQPGWQNKYPTDSWVTISSDFHANPNPASPEKIVLIPGSITPTSEPAQPYVY